MFWSLLFKVRTEGGKGQAFFFFPFKQQQQQQLCKFVQKETLSSRLG
jgi:hypothetical protein